MKTLPLHKTLLVILFLSAISVFSSQRFYTQKAPSWVNKLSLAQKDSMVEQRSFQYVLIDVQENIIEEAIYRHFAIKVFNPEGIQLMSDLDFSYDPTYESFYLHQLQLVRDGEVIDKIQSSKIQIIQREESMERSIYDGSLSVVSHLDDVREGDIIEFSYTIKGFNPLEIDHWSGGYSLQYNTPVNRIYKRLICSKDSDLQYRLENNAEEPIKVVSGDQMEYLWDISALEFVLYDNNVPSWYTKEKSAQFTQYKNWKEVVDWALPLYDYPIRDAKKILGELKERENWKNGPMPLIDFVQNEVRYLGLESGISAYKPHAPWQVYSQRYGDCKDKSLLLVALLREEGIKAYPMLVSSVYSKEIIHELPSHIVFDHAVVCLEYNGKEYFVDPTISEQGGDMGHLYFPDYVYGLLIKDGETALKKLPSPEKPELKIKELFTLDSINGGVKIYIRTDYSGQKADEIRNYYLSNSISQIERDNLDYYSRLYPNIELDGRAKMIDNHRQTTNMVSLDEYYKIEHFWQWNEDSSSIHFEVYPIVLFDAIEEVNSANRKMPYYLGLPYEYHQRTTLVMPSEWNISEDHQTILGEDYRFVYQRERSGEKIIFTHDYQLNKSYIEAHEVDDYVKDHDEISDLFSYHIIYNYGQVVKSSGFSWISFLVSLISILIAFYLALKLYRSYDPKVSSIYQQTAIDGWMILPLIALFINPIWHVVNTINIGFFSNNLWEGAIHVEASQTISHIFFILVELIYNSFLLVYYLLILVLFLKKRSSLPRLITILLLLEFVVPFIDLMVADQLIPGLIEYDQRVQIMTQLIGRFIIAGIWIPYFNVSKQVKTTFISRYQQPEPMIPISSLEKETQSSTD